MSFSTETIAAPVAPVAPSTGAYRPLGLDEVRITGGVWARRQGVNGDATLPHIEHWLEKEGWLGNFDLAAAGTLPEGRRGREFADSEIYKYLEAVAWEIGRRGGDDALEESFRAIVKRVDAAQEADGYLSTAFGRPGQGARWSALEWGHELYCIGHLLQAAVARERTRPGADDGLLDIARHAAELVCEVFGPDGMDAVCGHPEIEVGLAELGRVTGDARFVAQASLFVDRRGRGTLGDIEYGRGYFQDDVPVRQMTVLGGHAVRANYLAAGAVDTAVENGDGELFGALRRQWHTTAARRTYVTGGQGSHHQDEAFGDDWELPSDRAYSETCAGIASIMFSWRLLLAEGGAAYADLIERTLYNVVATSPSEEGTSFFYANTLHRRMPALPTPADEISPRASSSLRAPWFEVSCCPPNVARTLASLSGYVATSDTEGVQVHQYAPSEIRTVLADGRRVSLDVRTEYPAEGLVSVGVTESLADPVTISLRVPDWAAGATLRVRRGTELLEEQQPAPGYASVRYAFTEGDLIELDLPMAPRFTAPDPRIDAVRGSVVVERGPEVFCLESVDLPVHADDLSAVTVDVRRAPRDSGGEVTVSLRYERPADDSWPYAEAAAAAAAAAGAGAGAAADPGAGAAAAVGADPGAGAADGAVEGARTAGGSEAPGDGPDDRFDAVVIPYNRWAERGPSTMRVWIRAEG